MKNTIIVYIENNALSQRLLGRMLRVKTHYTLLFAPDTRMGMRLIQQENPDIILIDIDIPDLEGLTLAKHLKTSPQFSHIPLIGVTGKQNCEDQTDSFGMRFDGYLVKPVFHAEIMNVLDDMPVNRVIA